MSGEVEAVRWAVYSRDDGLCIAFRTDEHAGPCYDRWGHILPQGRVPFDEGEMDYVRFGASYPRHKSPRDHVWACPGHHRGTGPSAGFQWCTSNRARERAYLDEVNAMEGA